MAVHNAVCPWKSCLFGNTLGYTDTYHFKPHKVFKHKSSLRIYEIVKTNEHITHPFSECAYRDMVKMLFYTRSIYSVCVSLRLCEYGGHV